MKIVLMNKDYDVTGGVGFWTLLFIVFTILKLTHVIDWSWWYVTMPLWLPFAIFTGFLIAILFLVIFVLLVAAIFGVKL